MTTQDQKTKKVEIATRQRDDVQAKVTKVDEALRKLETDYTAKKAELTGKREALAPELVAANEHLDWTQKMPVSGRASGEVGAIETPAADAAE